MCLLTHMLYLITTKSEPSAMVSVHTIEAPELLLVASWYGISETKIWLLKPTLQDSWLSYNKQNNKMDFPHLLIYSAMSSLYYFS